MIRKHNIDFCRKFRRKGIQCRLLRPEESGYIMRFPHITIEDQAEDCSESSNSHIFLNAAVGFIRICHSDLALKNKGPEVSIY